MGALIISILLFLAVADICLSLLLRHKFPRMRFLPFMLLCLGLQYILFISDSLQLELNIDQSIFSPPLAIFALAFFFMFLWEYVGEKQLKSLFVILILTIPFLEFLIFYYRPFTLKSYHFYHQIWQTTNLTLTIVFWFLFVYRLQKIRIRKTEHKNLIMMSNFIFLVLSALIGYTLGHHKGSTETIVSYLFDTIDFIFLCFLYFHLFGLYKLQLEDEKRYRLEALSPLKRFQENILNNNRAKEETKNNKKELQVQHQVTGGHKQTHHPDNLQSMQEKIVRFFEQHADVYLDVNFKLSILAEYTSLPRTSISRVFIDGLHTSFNDYLNKKRILQALRILSERKDITITELTESCGYKSRASFYKHFKIVTGKSIMEYRNEMR